MTTSLSGLAQRLVQAQLLTASEAQQLTATAQQQNLSLMTLLLNERRVPPRPLAELAAGEFGLPFCDLNTLDLSNAPTQLVSDQLLNRLRLLPLQQRDEVLCVGLADPSQLSALDEVRFHTGLAIEAWMVDHDQLERALQQWLDKASDVLLESKDTEAQSAIHRPPMHLELTSDTDDAPIIRFVQQMLTTAIRQGASDLHFEPYEHRYRIRFRIDGVLKDIAQPPVSVGPKLAARLKILANLDISERRLPQDGRLTLRLDANTTTDFRVSTLPTLFGEKVVLRVLDASTARLNIEALGLEEDSLQRLLRALKKPQGMILVTGPTGSGKTVSLYAALSLLNREGINISSAEDPVEIHLEGVNQVSINPRIGLEFATVLRAFLRQDPDVIMVGEIRDLDTANTAIRAAQTGHLVLSTLHTNSAAATLIRMLNMGVPAFNLIASIQLIVAQRLVRRLCAHCKAATTLSQQEWQAAGLDPAQFGQTTLFKAVGCEHCHQGYKGRLGLFEVVELTAEMAQSMLTGASVQALENALADAGYDGLRQAGLRKVLAGLTSLEEVHRITVDD
ncbi:type IV-A pilus assembly ATPase PilB [Saccharospirillum mangrovi]|uniref:type IV-A pilus assembly ATPase PilB n=1 Tax=Saccharospirillum mangrovi TaxID=2161747 RepID=UPI000D38D5C3|nr:type IV-A pilus assembly ATPase PilB [Saccharospirillum mangrovi]